MDVDSACYETLCEKSACKIRYGIRNVRFLLSFLTIAVNTHITFFSYNFESCVIFVCNRKHNFESQTLF